MSRIFWDSMLFIYFLEQHPIYGKRAREILRRIHSRRDELCTSSLAVGEVLVGPQKLKAQDVSAKIEGYFRSNAVTVIPFTHDVALRYAKLRATMKLEPPDAIHLASAAEEGVDVFITNDKDLIGLNVPGIQFIVGMNTDLF